MIKWRTAAVNDLTRIRNYISEFNPNAAQAVIERVLRSVDRLNTFPESGRYGQAAPTREIVVPGLPYIVVYAISNSDIEIIAVFHAAQNRR
jgi:toxin ParE1/3/4